MLEILIPLLLTCCTRTCRTRRSQRRWVSPRRWCRAWRSSPPGHSPRDPAPRGSAPGHHHHYHYHHHWVINVKMMVTFLRPVMVCTSELQMVAPSSFSRTSPSFRTSGSWNCSRVIIGDPSSGNDDEFKMMIKIRQCLHLTFHGTRHKTW